MSQVFDDDDEKRTNEKDQSVMRKRIVIEQLSASAQIFDPITREPMLQHDIPNKIIVARGKKISFYYERARHVLRLFDGMIVIGFGSTVSIACSLVEVLQRNQMAVICHIETKLQSPDNYIGIHEKNYNNMGQQQYYKNTQQTGIEFHLSVGKYGNYLSGYHQRKIIELFEKCDPNITGLVSVADIQSIGLYQLFHCNNNQIIKAEKWLKNKDNLNGPNDQFLLPDFIKYCSIFIHPLIKDNIFKRILFNNFGIGKGPRYLRNQNKTNHVTQVDYAQNMKSNDVRNSEMEILSLSPQSRKSEHKLELIQEDLHEIDAFNILNNEM